MCSATTDRAPVPSTEAGHSRVWTEAELQTAWEFLKNYTLSSFRGTSTSYVSTPDKRQSLRDTIKAVYHSPWPPAAWVPPRPPSSSSPSQLPAPPSEPTISASDSTPSTLGDQQSVPLVMIGLMASDVRLGARAMRDYCTALGLPVVKPVSRVPGVESVAAVQGAVYMKYNSQSQVCYVSPYLGKERGVLLQLGVEQLGHFPLGLWDEGMTAPPPSL